MFVFNPLNLNYFKQVPEVQNALAPYSLKFAQCILPILYLEGGLRSDGGLNNGASDRGGLTKYGISQRAYPHVDIKNLTLAQAVSLYHRDYWRAMHCEQSPAGVDFMLLDGAVQHGAPAMTQLTQRLVNSKPDGRMGPKTLAAILERPALSLTVLLSVNRGRKYARICANDSSQKPNLEGWYNRLAHVTEFAVNQLSGVA
ncbi:secretion activator protein [Pseudoalteromonas sp. BSi20652]|uniref:glycoside hydrolase family 108 protein n=1 Tax=Pseudoalteromonas sp. BSi20652 TaxID=388384 RepID=UPI000231917E|nr:N-acetylmuramidase [Pseudoalteromonas sp. BSi20652]GAA61840.1 secretion activator protein [Pseudoalteromonas sp. BSi20652]